MRTGSVWASEGESRISFWDAGSVRITGYFSVGLW